MYHAFISLLSLYSPIRTSHREPEPTRICMTADWLLGQDHLSSKLNLQRLLAYVQFCWWGVVSSLFVQQIILMSHSRAPTALSWFLLFWVFSLLTSKTYGCLIAIKIFASLFHYLYFTIINSFLLWFRYWFYWYSFLPNIGSFFASIVTFTARVSCWSMLECYQTY